LDKSTAEFTSEKRMKQREQRSTLTGGRRFDTYAVVNTQYLLFFLFMYIIE
jgi:hypothetical protein